jgi:hypothetical protein
MSNRNDYDDRDHDAVTGEVMDRAPGALAVTESFGGMTLQQQNETAIAAVQARAQAIVQSKYVMALKRPRNHEQTRLELLKDCSRPSFAAIARYKRPQGKRPAFFIKQDGADVEVPEGTEGAKKKWVPNFIEGPSIRFVEAALRALGNIEPAVQSLYDDERKIILRCEVCDFEKNLSYSQEITVEKSVERKDLKTDRETGRVLQVPLGRRTNSYGDPVYIVAASEDEVRLKVNRNVSMTLRTLGLRLVPGDLLDEAMQTVIATQKKDVKDDPARARRELLDSFAKLGVQPVDLQAYLGGRTVEQASPDEILELRIIGVSIRDGEIKWTEAIAASPYRDDAEESAGEGAKKSPQQEKSAKVAETIAKKKDAAKKAAAEAKAKAEAAKAAQAGAAAQEPAKDASPAADAPKAEAKPAAAQEPAQEPAEEQKKPAREPGED